MSTRRIGNLTPAVFKALQSIAENAVTSGWATKWAVDIQRQTLNRCLREGFLESGFQGTITTLGKVGFNMYRLTEKGREELERALDTLPECPLCGRTDSHVHYF